MDSHSKFVQGYWGVSLRDLSGGLSTCDQLSFKHWARQERGSAEKW